MYNNVVWSKLSYKVKVVIFIYSKIVKTYEQPFLRHVTIVHFFFLYKGIKPKRAFTSCSCHILDVKLLETSRENPDEGPSGERSKN